MQDVAVALLTLGASAVLLKGGHLPGEERWWTCWRPRRGWRRSRRRGSTTEHTHGTGCTLASAIAAGLAQGMGLRGAVVRARAYVRAAIAAAPGFGAGHGPLDHSVTVCP